MIAGHDRIAIGTIALVGHALAIEPTRARGGRGRGGKAGKTGEPRRTHQRAAPIDAAAHASIRTGARRGLSAWTTASATR